MGHSADIDVQVPAATAMRASSGRGVIVATYNRPNFLKRSLASIAGQFDHAIVIDDGSSGSSRRRNESLAADSGLDYFHLGRNRGLACAQNIGLVQMFSNCAIEWISLLEDDVLLVPDAMERLNRVIAAFGGAALNCLFTGYNSDFHTAYASDTVDGIPVRYSRTCSGQHMHAHRTFWQNILPIPTVYPCAPKESGGVFAGQGSDTDWWISNWAPSSPVKRGGSVCVLPGLAKTMGRGRSTWGSVGY
jgi:glycosyltransferase involved in cell wall biosynthesis